MSVPSRASKPWLSFALLAFLAAGSGSAAPLEKPSAVSGAPQAEPWYAGRLTALGFDVFREPAAVPDFGLPALAGGDARLAAMKGKLVLLNFWATWCPPCRAEMPSIQKLWDASRVKGLVVMAVSVGEKEATVRSFIAKEKFGFPVYIDAGGSVGSLYGVRSIPTTYIVDKEGRAIARAVGAIEYGSPEALSLFAELAVR